MAIIGKLSLMSSKLYIIKQFVEALLSRRGFENMGNLLFWGYALGEIY